MQAVVILCQRRAREAVLELLEDWQEQATVTLYGVTTKGSEGFVITHWTPSVPQAFQHQHLDAEPRSSDSLISDVLIVHPKENRPV